MTEVPFKSWKDLTHDFTAVLQANVPFIGLHFAVPSICLRAVVILITRLPIIVWKHAWAWRLNTMNADINPLAAPAVKFLGWKVHTQA